jgi:hypothetical protein
MLRWLLLSLSAETLVGTTTEQFILNSESNAPKSFG